MHRRLVGAVNSDDKATAVGIVYCSVELCDV